MAAGLERAEQQRKNLVADVAHELRTPLSNIQGYFEAMRDDVLEPNEETLNTVHAQTLHLARLVEDLRLLAQTESEDFRLNLEQESLGDVLRHSVEGFRARSSSMDVGLNLDIPDELPMLLIDRTRISQVLGNLLENAVRHSSSGGEVNVVAGVSEGRVVVTVADEHDAVGGAGGEPGDDAALDQRERVRLKNGLVVEGTGVALFAVAEDELLGGRVSGQEAPLGSCWEGSSTPSSESRCFNLIQGLLGIQVGQGLVKGLVATVGHILIDVQRVNVTGVPENDAVLTDPHGVLVKVGYAVWDRGVASLLGQVSQSLGCKWDAAG